MAHVIARVFPSRRIFAERVATEGIDEPYVFQPYPKDVLAYKSAKIVEYQTPAQTDGLGTTFWLLENDKPISGVAMLVGDPPDLVHLSVRLPPNLADLAPVIIQQVERDAAALPK